MKTFLVAVSLAFMAACAAAPPAESQQKPEPPSASGRAPVVVELFTSEGCSSCPPADRLLSTLDREQATPGAEVIALEFHVDYWDRLGWKDPFSSAMYTQRQEFYVRNLRLNSAYTPQMIVDGAAEFVGSDAARASAAIAEAARRPKLSVAANLSGGSVRIRVEGNRSAASSVFVAVAEDDLRTSVGAGENAGRSLEHRAVVRALNSAGSLAAGDAPAEFELPLAFASDWKSDRTRIVVFVQENESRRITGAVRKPR